jgi:CheY-like chemotaxis protein
MGNVIYLSGRDRCATILLVESQPLVRLATAAFLRQRDFVVVEATDGEEALKFLRAGRPVDLVFSAVELSGAILGLGLARTIGREFPQVKIVLNGSGDGTSLRLERPYDLADLEGLIRKLMTESTCRKQ